MHAKQYRGIPQDDEMADTTRRWKLADVGPQPSIRNMAGGTVSKKLFVTMLESVVVLNILIWMIVESEAVFLRSSTDKRYTAEYIPREPLILRTFEDTAFAAPRTPLKDAAWEAIMPKGLGFIPLPEPEEYNAPSDARQVNVTGKQVWGVSVFHQLHCVTMLRTIFWDHVEGVPDRIEWQHAAHCFDFLRQAIGCFGDTTLEMPGLKNADGTVSRLEFKSPRLCRDYDEIKRFAEEAHLASLHE